jgi:arylsulfatase A-like enzyme
MQPNIIYILSDQHRGQAMSHAGDPNVRTPIMDRLAHEGVSFARAYANCPICTPSRGTIFSGRHAHAGPVQGFWDVYKATSPSTATLLRSRGYHTACFGKWHCGIVLDQLPQSREGVTDGMGSRRQVRTPERHRGGFQDWFGCETGVGKGQYDPYYYRGGEVEPTQTQGYSADVFTDLLLKYLDDYHREEPLFAVLSVVPPHFPLQVPPQWDRHDPGSIELPPGCADDPEIRRWLATYYAMIENLDWNIGRVVDAINRLPKFRDTVVVYISDHGEFLGSHGRAQRKEHPHEESVRIPAIFHCPRLVRPQGRVGGLFSLVDLLPTTLGLLGMESPPHSQGFDFSPALRGERCAGPAEVLLEMVGNPRWNMDFVDWRGVVTQDWKYAYYETGEELLFDLAHDPAEQRNLAACNPGQKRVMQQRLLQCLRQSREPYFDVLIEHGALPPEATTDIGAERGSWNHHRPGH